MKKSKKMKLLALLLAVVLATAGLGLLFLPASASITATGNWYKSNQSTLYVNNASDLWAFATALQGGNTFAGQTVKLTADITVNDGWDAFGGSTPGDQWPLTSPGKYFAGTFDGQGHTISGLYASISGFGYGFFGNVPRGKTATVKNLKIVNSKILNEDGSKTGGIFGIVSTEADAAIADDYYVNTTKAVVENVHLDLCVVTVGKYAGGDSGVGGFIGCNAADVVIKNSTFDGTVTSPSRGVAAFVGATYPTKIPNTSYDAYKTYTTLENCSAMGMIDVSESNAVRFAGGLLGYANANTDQISAKNVILACDFLGAHVAGSKPVGYLFGGSWCSANSYRNGTTVDYQNWTLENVFVLETSLANYPMWGRKADGIKTSGEVKNFTDLKNYLSTNIMQNVTLRNDLCYNLYLPVLDENATVTINGEAVAATEDGAWFDRYSLDGILPQQMTDTFSLYVKQTIGGEVFEIRKTTSIRSYLYSLWKTDTLSDAERNLIADLLRYGAAAQNYANYNSSSLVTTGFSLAGWGTEFDASKISPCYAKAGVENAQYDVTDAALALNNALSMYFRFTAADLSGLSVDVTVGERTKTYTSFTKIGTNAYMFSCDVIYAHEMGLPITVTLKQNGSQIGQQLTYSVADYVKAFLAQDATGNATLTAQQELVRKLYAYGLSAEAYNDSTRCVITDGLTSDYVIVYDDTAPAETVEIAYHLSKMIEAKTGVAIPFVKDSVAEQQKEILLGSVNSRSASVSELAQIRATDRNGYRARVAGDKIVIAAESEWLLDYAVNRFAETITTHGGITWSIPLNYCDIVDLPTVATNTTIQADTPYYAGNHNYTWSYYSTATNFTSEYAAYVAKLKNDGFVEYDTNTVNNNTFGTYLKTTDGYNTVVYTMHYPNSNNMRVTYGPIGYLPSTNKIPASEAGLITMPSLVVNARETADLSASGMSYIFQLVDGSFVIVDGGANDQDVKHVEKNENDQWVTNDKGEKSEDCRKLYELLVEMTPNGQKPVIAAWLISHAHGDHMALINQFLMEYHSFVDIKLAIHNFPNFETIRYGYCVEDDGNITDRKGSISLVTTFKNRMKTYYPDAPIWDCHSGQTLYLPDCEIEILFTQENNIGNPYYNTTTSYGEVDFFSGNDICICFRVTIGDTTAMMLGDCGGYGLRTMAENYQNALESDILQVTHHGENGGNFPCYEYVNPKICLWPTNQVRFETGYFSGQSVSDKNNYWYDTDTNQIGSSTKNTGTNSHTYANWWLRNTPWTRADGSSGEREHYWTSTTEDQTLQFKMVGGGVVVTPQLPLK